MRILLLGANGQVGWELQRSLAPLAHVKACGREEADLENGNQLQEVIQSFHPNIIVNAAAYTAVDKAESEPERAYRINAEAVGEISVLARELGALLVHYSTDYVFDGTKSGAYDENDIANPQSVYGKTKHAGEILIQNSGCNHLIFRTSWVYARRGNNFAKTMIKLAKERDDLKVVSDQIGVPTSAEFLADVTMIVLHQLINDPKRLQKQNGIYHLVPSGETSWYGFAKYVISEASRLGMSFKIDPENIHPITTSQYPLPASRPANSKMNTDKLKDAFFIETPDWQVHLDRLIPELVEQEQQ